LFLDEIGEIPLDLQPKLLRVLQDQEFERLGGTQTLKVDFRLVAATNRDLLNSVNRREFRSDLYYRLNVFPLRTPPLRERREDIPLLIEHFVRKYASRMNKSILSIPAKTMETLVQWAWPGNIRELQNFIERAVILTTGECLTVPMEELKPLRTKRLPSDNAQSLNLREVERAAIVEALRKTNGRVSGPHGAAALLGLKRTTLQYRMRLLNIKLTYSPPES
jgi:formate hydrogenlyase transcriptional activator